MTQTNNASLSNTRDRIDFIPIISMGLLCFIIWKASGINLNISADTVRGLTEQKYQELEQWAAGEASILDILTWLLLGITGIYINLINKDRALFMWIKAWPLAVMLVIIILSILWSSVPDIALRRVARQLLFIAVVAGIVMGASSPRQIIRVSVLLTGFLMGINFAAVLLFPAAATNVVGDFEGFLGQKNTAGQFAMISVFVWFAAARWSSHMWTRVVLYCGTFFWFLFLLGTYSRTSIICTVAAIPLVVLLRYCLQRPVAGVVFGFSSLFICLCIVFALLTFNVSFSDIVALVEGEKVTLTRSRVQAWEIAYNVFLDHKVLGTGFGSLWLTSAVPPVEEYTNLPHTPFLVGLTQAHSGYFDVLATLGIVGAIALLLFLASCTWTVVKALASRDKSEDGPQFAEFSGFIFFAALIFNLTQSAFLANNSIWMFLVLCYLLLCSSHFPTDPESPLAHEPDPVLKSRPETSSRLSPIESKSRLSGIGSR